MRRNGANSGKDPQLLARWPWIEEAAMEGASIIDLEFRHGVLNAEEGNGRTARFYFRRQRERLDASGSSDQEREKLDVLKHRVREAGQPIEEFRDPVSLGEMVYDELIEIIKRDFADARPPTPLEAERSKHVAFAASRRRAYIPNPEYLKRLNDWFASEDQPLIIYAESGSGKSSLVSFWCEQLRRRQPELPIVEHYVGIGAGGSDHLGIIRHVMEEIKERFDRSEELPTKPEEMERDFANWLGFSVGRPLLLVIDGINQLTGRALELHWLPPMMPAGVKLVISSTVEQTLVDLRSRGWSELGMQPLKEREREAVVVRFLAEYHKALSPEQVKLIAEDAKCSHPLFLRTLLEELRLHGTHEHLERALMALLATTGTEDLFQRVLERLEDDYGTKSVREVMSLLWCSRGGLNEEELAELTGIGRLKLSTLLLGLDYHLVRRDGVLTFFHDYLRRAVEKRYLTQSSARQERYRLLAEYFERAEITLRTTLELLHALERSGDRGRVDVELSRIERFMELWRSEEYEVLRLWSEREVAEVTRAYGVGLAAWEAQERSDVERIAVLGAIGTFYERIGAWSESERMERRRLETARTLGDRAAETAALVSLSWVTQELGRMEDAEALARQAEEISLELGDRRGIGRAMNNRGNVHTDRGEYIEALACFAEQEEISRALGDRGGIAAAVGNRGNVYASRGEYIEALACYAEQEEISRALGDRRGIARVVGNRGFVHGERDEYIEALACFAEWEEISRALGDRRGIANAVGNRGFVYWSLGEYIEALACFAEWEEISRALGDRRGIANAVGNRGFVHASRGEYSEALACYREAATEHRQIGYRYGLTYWLDGTANVLVELVEAGDSTTPDSLSEYVPGAEPKTWRAQALAMAREHAEECATISEELSKEDTLFSARVLLTRIAAAGGQRDAALQQLAALLEESTDDEQRAELHYRLRKLDAADMDHRTEALRLFETLFEKTPKYDYRKRIDELSKPTTPDSDDAAAQ